MSISIGGNGNKSDSEQYQNAEGDMSDVHMMLNENDYGGDSGVGEQAAETAE